MHDVSIRTKLLADATDLRNPSHAYRRAVDQAIIEFEACVLKSRATLDRSWETIKRVNRSLTDDTPAPPAPPADPIAMTLLRSA